LEYFLFDHPALNTFDANHAEIWSKRDGFNLIGKKKVEVVPLTELLGSLELGTKKIDLMSIDVEGYDLSVLESNNWDRYRPRLLLVEVDLIINIDTSPIYLFLIARSYKLLGICRGTWFFEDIKTG
jgi:hypothetical protein